MIITINFKDKRISIPIYGINKEALIEYIEIAIKLGLTLQITPEKEELFWSESIPEEKEEQERGADHGGETKYPKHPV